MIKLSEEYIEKNHKIVYRYYDRTVEKMVELPDGSLVKWQNIESPKYGKIFSNQEDAIIELGGELLSGGSTDFMELLYKPENDTVLEMMRKRHPEYFV